MSKTITLASLNRDVDNAARQLRAATPTDAEAINEARAALRKAKEAVRVFAYRAKPCFTRSGHALRP